MVERATRNGEVGCSIQPMGTVEDLGEYFSSGLQGRHMWLCRIILLHILFYMTVSNLDLSEGVFQVGNYDDRNPGSRQVLSRLYKELRNFLRRLRLGSWHSSSSE